MLTITNINKSARAERMLFRWLPIMVAGSRKNYARIEWLNFWFEFNPASLGYICYFGGLGLISLLLIALGLHLVAS